MGNAALRSRGWWQNFWPDATVFAFCRNVSFAILSDHLGASTETLFAPDPGQWISKLKAERIFGFRLHHISRTNLRDDRLSAGFVGGGERWLIETTRVEISDFWEARWRVRNQNAPDRKTWDVKYFRVSQNRPSVSPGARGLPALRRELEDVLVNIKKFARRQNLAVFADYSNEASS